MVSCLCSFLMGGTCVWFLLHFVLHIPNVYKVKIIVKMEQLKNIQQYKFTK